MRKLLSFITALACISAFSCTAKTSDSSVSAPAVTAEQLYLKAAPIALGDEPETIDVIDKTGENVLIFGQDARGGYTGYVTDCTFADQRSFRIIPEEGERVVSACMCKYRKTAVLTEISGNMQLYIYNDQGALFKTLDLGKSVIPADTSVILMANEDDFILSIGNHHFIAYSKDGDDLGEIDLRGGSVWGFTKDSEGVPAVLLEVGGSLSVVPIIGTELGDSTPCSDLNSSALAICSGSGDYTLFARFTDGLYGLTAGQWVKLSDLGDCGIAPMDIWGMVSLGGNELAVMTVSGGRTGLYMLSERDISEIKTKKTVKFAVMGYDESMMPCINRYNTSSENYRIEVVDYFQGGAYDRDEIMSRLRLDIIGGDAPDLICGYIPQINTDNYMDVFDLIDNDPDISRDDFIPGILDAMAINGRLTVVAPDIQISTLMVRSSDPFARENWSYEDFMSAYGSMPEGMEFMYHCNNVMFLDNFRKLVRFGDFVDYKKGTCNFTDPEFIKLMDFFRDNNIGKTWDDYKRAIDAGLLDGYEEDAFAFEDKKLMVYRDSISSPIELWLSMRNEEELTMAGLPSADGKGSCATPYDDQFSIPLNAAEPEGAWDVLKYLIAEEYGSYGRIFNSIPIYNPSFERNCARCLRNEPGHEDEVYITEDVDVTITRYKNRDRTETEPIEPLTEAELDKVRQFVYGAAKNFYREDEILWNSILLEELRDFFEGAISAEEAAAHIQDRASIYLSEKS